MAFHKPSDVRSISDPFIKPRNRVTTRISMLYRDKDPVMAADDLLAPMAIIFCIFCAKPQRREHILLNSPAKKIYRE
jgi:hypothetical protein